MPFTKNDPNINRQGRPPKGQSWAELIRIAGGEVEPESGKQLKLLVVEQLYSKAIKGDISAIKEIIDRTDGRAKITENEPLGTQGSNIDINDPRILKTLLLTAQALVENADSETDQNID